MKNDTAVVDLSKKDLDTIDSIDSELKDKGSAISVKKETLMSKLVLESANPPSDGDLIEGTVIGIEKAKVYVDLPPFGTGVIYGREYNNARDVIKKINIGDKIAAKIVEAENKDGYMELSLKEARQALIWSEADSLIREKKVLELPVKEANKGGLIIEWQGIQGFLPASQLKTEHYPRVEDGDKDRILEELKKLVNQKIAVCIISALPKEGKLIFSEKNLEQKEKEKMISKYAVGDSVEGEVTGIVDFGIFVKVEDGLEGLVHISEIDWALVEDLKKMFKVGEKVKVKIIDIKEGKISLSIKALKENPWIEAAKKYKKDDMVKGVIIKFNKHGALASIEEGVAGLVHISEFGSESKLREALELGKTYSFKITLFDAKEQKMALSFVQEKKG
ncbi:MAG: S1 RNA-binding domain-containing protein [Candidatus Paceibacterota bacterium]